MEGIAPNSSCPRGAGGGLDQKKAARPQEQLNCPRCSSTNTKFCYYNNYSLTQPRYFCKTCRRYWTEGGSLRNVPVGGGSRKNKKLTTTSTSSSSSSSATTTTTTSSSKVPDLNPKTMQGGGHDLNLTFPSMDKYHDISQYVEMPNATVPASLSALELLRSGMASRGLNPYAPNSMMQNSNSLYNPSGFPMQEVKPSLGFSIDHGVGNRSSYHDHDVQENSGGRLLFPFGDHVKQLSHHAGADQVDDNNNNNNKEQGNSSSTGYWTGMLGEGSW